MSSPVIDIPSIDKPQCKCMTKQERAFVQLVLQKKNDNKKKKEIRKKKKIFLWTAEG